MVTRRPWWACALVCLMVAVAGCPDPREWEPRGEVRWVQWREVDEGGVRTALATAEVTNTGRVSLTGFDLALTVTTDRDRYYVQFASDLALEPGKAAFQTVAITFRDAAETAGLGGLRVVSESFR